VLKNNVNNFSLMFTIKRQRISNLPKKANINSENDKENETPKFNNKNQINKDNKDNNYIIKDPNKAIKKKTLLSESDSSSDSELSGKY